MVCHHCGKELPEDSRFCPYCGASQAQQDKKRPSGRSIVKGVLIVLVALLAIVRLMELIPDKEETPVSLSTTPVALATIPAPVREEPTPAPTLPPATQAPTETTIPLPEDGWYRENGQWYYYLDGQPLVDIQSIDGDYYYFYEDGALAVNSRIETDYFALQTDSEGVIQRVIYNEIWGEWAEKSYSYGNGGHSSILNLSFPVKECTSMTLHLEASGNRGAKMNGTWKFYVRSGGKWKMVQKLDFKEPSGDFEIQFDTPMSFDAITAHPTKEGNASYSCNYHLADVDCPFYTLLE